MLEYKGVHYLHLKCLAFLSITNIAAGQLGAALYLLASLLQILCNSTKESHTANLHNFNLL